jgi:lysophospholipase L1-like esterase
MMPDRIHLSSGGYEIWAKAILPTVTELLNQKS